MKSAYGNTSRQAVDLIPTRSGSIEVVIFEIPGDALAENKGNYHNPTRQRGIRGHATERPKLNPSLTCRVAKIENAQLQNENIWSVKYKNRGPAARK